MVDFRVRIIKKIASVDGTKQINEHNVNREKI